MKEELKRLSESMRLNTQVLCMLGVNQNRAAKDLAPAYDEDNFEAVSAEVEMLFAPDGPDSAEAVSSCPPAGEEAPVPVIHHIVRPRPPATGRDYIACHILTSGRVLRVLRTAFQNPINRPFDSEPYEETCLREYLFHSLAADLNADFMHKLHLYLTPEEASRVRGWLRSVDCGESSPKLVQD